MKIGIVTTWQERGAAYVSRQYRESLQTDHEIFIYARGGEHYAIGDKYWDDPTVTWGKKIPLHVAMSIDLADFKTWILKNKLDLVFFNEQQWWDPVLLCQDLKVKTGSYIDYYTPETVPLFAIYDFLICNTKRHQSVFSWHPQAVYIPWGTDLKIFQPRSSAPTNPGLVTFFHSAGVSPERKGTDLVIKAWAKITGPAKLLIHTQIDLTKTYPELADLISELTTQQKLKFYQGTVTAPGLYHLGDIYVYPSRLDGIGLTLPEALACGLPVITSDNPPMNEFIDENNGQLVKIDSWRPRSDNYYWPLCDPNLESLTEKMQFYIDNIASLSNYKKQARRSAEEKLNWQVNSQPLAKLFPQFKIIDSAQKNSARQAIINYEAQRSNQVTKLYRRYPRLFRPFNWLWPLIKQKYIQK